jgi:hypothetical protein
MDRNLVLSSLGLALTLGFIQGADNPVIVKSLPVPAQLRADGVLYGVQWQGDAGLSGRMQPMPLLSRLGPSLEPVDQIKIEIPLAKSVQLRFGGLTGAGDLAYSGYAADDQQHGAPFLAFYPKGSAGGRATVVRTFPPLSPVAMVGTSDEHFLVLFSRPKTGPGVTFAEQDYPAVGAYDNEGKPLGTVVSFKQLHLPPEITSIDGARKSNPWMTSAGDRIFIFVPRLSQIVECTNKGEFVRTISVTLPGGKDISSVQSLAATKNRIVATVYAPKGSIPGWSGGPRAIYTEDGSHWNFLLPNENGQAQWVIGASHDDVVVLVGRDRMVWVR